MTYYQDLQDDTSCDSSNDHNKIMENAKKLDKGYNKIYRNVIRSDGKVKRTKVEIYTSRPNGKIRNAETGEYYKYKVGTMDEDLFFKVMISTGEVPSGPLTLFYDNPEHYERHQYLELDDLIKKRWEVERQCRISILNQLSKLNTKSRL